MTKHYNKKEMKERRKELRANMTYCEKLVWKRLRKRKMEARFHRQYSIDGYVLDFYCPKLKLAVEIDGEVHEEFEQKEYDKNRQEYLESFGITFLRITNDEINRDFDEAVKRIEEKIEILREKIDKKSI